MTEVWRPVVGYEDLYQVSSMGRVLRSAGGRGARAGRLLLRSAGDGYRYVMLSCNDRKRTFGVHVLVAEAFLGRRPRGKMPNHKNFVRSDNRVSNLEWLTQRQNVRHAVAAGRIGGRPMPGRLNGRAILTEKQVGEILHQKGKVGQRALARLCGVSKSCIQFIHQRKHWREFPKEVRS